MSSNKNYQRELKVGMIAGRDTEAGREFANFIADVILGVKAERPDLFEIDLPFATLSKDDEDMDALMMAGKFEINACIMPYYRELRHHRVDELLNKIGIGAKGLFTILNNLLDCIKENTDRPIYVQNTITDTIKYYEEYPGCGQVIQILILQGIIIWFENCDINEGDSGYREAESLCQWVYQRLIEVSTFYFIHFNKDENSKPLDDYLSTLDVGKVWEQVLNQQGIDAEGNDELPAQGSMGNNSIADSDLQKSILNLAPNKLKYLFNELTKDGYFFPKDTNRDHFNYVFGGGVLPDDFAPLCWKRTKGALSELIIHIVGKSSVPRPINRAIEFVFIDPENNAIKGLSNPHKDEVSGDYGALQTITNALKPRS